MKKCLVTGAGGFLGNHLVNFLVSQGYWVRGVSRHKPLFTESKAHEFIIYDLSNLIQCLEITKDINEVYCLASHFGGGGYLKTNSSDTLYDNLITSFNTIEASKRNRIDKLLYVSSSCVYPKSLQENSEQIPSFNEKDLLPANPENLYGWEKVISEILCNKCNEENKLDTRIIRFMNNYGPHDIWDGGRERVISALCRKVAIAKLKNNSSIEIWGDGTQVRSYCYIDDCVQGVYKLMKSSYTQPLNVCHKENKNINEIVDMLCTIAGVNLQKVHIDAPPGPKYRLGSTNKLSQALDWTPSISLQEGLKKTYTWIEGQVKINLK